MCKVLRLRAVLLCLTLSLVQSFVATDSYAKRSSSPSPVGYWKMIHDKTKKPEAIVRVWKQKGKLYAKIVKLFIKKGEDPNPKCNHCKGWRKNRPIRGMLFVWNLEEKGKGVWSGGKILDPDEGKVYTCKIWVAKSGKELKVRGYVWVFYRTQTWYRVPAPSKK
ncbi:MAG: DUF2147 domain-containing protein [Deltaproteobacteria bacterium]|nr:MAG: DUF2147 domain-containing protein [Deltaproteobacteria bacterium]